MANEIKLFTFALCPFAHRVRLTLAEKRLAADMIEIDLKNKPEGFESISPYGRVPVLVHDHLTIWESALIIAYLDERFPQPALMPTRPADRARARLWLDFADNRLLAPTHRLGKYRAISPKLSDPLRS
jgi:glutathione S-transferase